MNNNLLVHEYLSIQAETQPEKVALICDNLRWKYGEIDQKTNQVANWLLDHGLLKGDRVVVFLQNSAEAVISIYGILKAGGVFVIINPSTKSDKLETIINNCQAKLIITNANLVHTLSDFKPDENPIQNCLVCGTDHLPTDIPIPLTSFDEAVSYRNTAAPGVQMIDLDLACLVYTSGSTGVPKGVMSDHSNIVFVARSIISILKNTHQDIVLCALPLSFDYGLYQLLMCFIYGGTLVLEKNFYFPASVLKRIEEEKVTGFPGVPTMYTMILQMDLSQYNFSSLRYMTNTAAAMPVSHIQGLRQRFPQTTFYSMYGLTETKRTLYLPPEKLDEKPGSVGIAIPGTEVWLVDENNNRLPPGGTGELVIRGRHVMRGYWMDPEMTARRYRSGLTPGERLCYSGDIFHMDEDGYLYFVRRSDDIIKSRGEKVSPLEVELAIYELQDVKEVAVIGISDPVLGESIKAFIVLRNNLLTETQILAHCRKRLEDYKVPKVIEICSDLPKTSSGKIQKSGLKTCAE